MGWLKNLRVSYKVVCLIIVAILSLVFVGWTGVSYLHSVQTAMNDMANRHMKAVQLLGDCSITVRAMQARILETAGVEDRAQIEKNKKDIHDYMDVYEKDWQEYQALGMHAEKEEEVAGHWQAFKTQTDKMLDLCLAGNQKGALDIYNHDGIMAIIAWDDTMRPMREGIQQEAADLNEANSESVASAVKGMLLTAFVALVVLGLLAWAVTQSIVKPLGKMMADCKRLGDGDFRDEGVHTDEERIAAASEELTASSQQSAQASTQVAQSVQQASDAVVNQQKGIDVSTQSVGNVSETVQKLQGEADKVAEHAAAAFEQAAAGGKAIAASVEQIKSVEATVGDSTAIVDQLGARSQEIGQIVETISGIAEQTNLLALNAAIEAARAGEQGRGFSVVADEVRKLAEESAEAAKSVEGLRETFQGIQGYVNSVSQEVRQMAQAMRDAADAANGISGSIQEIDAQGATVASEMENVSAATEEQSASASEIAGASDSLAKLAQDLQGTLQKFRF